MVIIDSINSLDLSLDSTVFGFIHTLLAIPQIKLLLTGRENLDIRSLFPKANHVYDNLLSVPNGLVRRDVRHYLEHHFQSIATRFNSDLVSRGEKWPSVGDLDELEKQTGYLFLFAAAMIEYVKSPLHNPVRRLAALLAGSGT
jgi:hypothetical protein